MASCELMKEASLHQGRATIEEIRKALAGDCEWVTRRLLKRKGKQLGVALLEGRTTANLAWLLRRRAVPMWAQCQVLVRR
jgi:hypothetical protein